MQKKRRFSSPLSATKPLAIVGLLLCAGISESRAQNTAPPEPTTESTPVILFAEPGQANLTDDQAKVLTVYRSRLETDPSQAIHVVSLTDDGWSSADRERLIASADLKSDLTTFEHAPANLLQTQNTHPMQIATHSGHATGN